MGKDRSIRCRRCHVLNEPRTPYCVRCGASLASVGRGGRRRRRRVTAGGAVLGFTILIVLVVALLVLGVVVYRTMHPSEKVDPLAGRSGTTASTSTTLSPGSSGTGSSSTSTSLAVVMLRPTAATSSSALKPTTTNNFRAPNLVDSDLTTAWIEGAEGTGAGEWVKFAFSTPVTLARIDVANGNQKDEKHFTGDIRVKTVQLEYSSGSTQLVDLLDTQDLQSIKTLRERIDWIKVTIVSVYPGYTWEDAALSEVRLYGLAD
jgi:hypothetical protein